MNKKSTKRALLGSVLSLLLCCAMLIGTTFAWFTDSVSSNGNKIQSGTLKISLHKMEKNGTWTDISDTEDPLFNYNLWEPGYTAVQLLKVQNDGNLALKWQADLTYTGTISKLAEVIDVYVTTNELTAYPTGREVVLGWEKKGTLKDFIDGFATATQGELNAGENNKAYLGIALHMQESANNDYQTLDLGGNFDIKIFATQNTVEEDSFDNQYDADAPKTEVATAAELQKVLNEGGYAVLANDIAVEGNKRIYVPAGTYAVLDLNGHTLTSKDGGGSNTMAIYIDKGAVFTLNDSVGTGKVVSSCYGVYVKQNAKFIMNGGTLDVSGNGAYDHGVVVWNADFVMNGGTINAQHAVWASNYYRDTAHETGLNTCYVKIADSCTINSTGYADVEFADALDTVLDIPEALTTYPVITSDSDELMEALSQGNDVVLSDDMTVTGSVITTNGVTEAYGNKVGVAQYGGTLDGNGNTLTETGSSAYVIVTHGGTIKNLTIVGGGRGIVIYAPTEDVIIDNVLIDGPGYAINTAEHNGQDLIVTNSTVNGWTSLAGLDSVSFTNCKLGENSTKCWQNYGYDADYDRLIKPYGMATFTGCTFEKNFCIDLSELANGNTVTLTNCNCEGVVLTAENYANYITVELPDWANSIADCIVFN